MHDHDQDRADPLMNQPRERLAAWENSLRPARSSGRMWLLLGAAAVATAGYLAWTHWKDGSDPGRRKQQATPATAPDAKAPAAREDVRQPPVQDPPGQRVQRFAKCTSAGGTTTYSDAPCPKGTQPGEVRVRPDANLADGMSMEDRQASMQDNSVVAQSIAAHERRVAMNVGDAVSECAQWNALIASIDAQARQPLSAQEQDRLTAQRKQARDRQFALRC